MKQILVRGEPFYIHDTPDLLSGAIERDGDFFEAQILDYIKVHYPTHRTIVDIGANIGNHTVYFARYLRFDKLYAFEPMVDNYTILNSNVSSLLHSNNIFIARIALGDEEKEAAMVLDYGNSGAHRISDEPVATYPVKVVSLDSYNLKNVTLIKIDVEYYEPQVLVGAKETIQRCKPLILIEDTQNKYTSLLPDYELEQVWLDDFTYLYKWRI